jgi:CubicO group peptidase (beta-lactamase class C family)
MALQHVGRRLKERLFEPLGMLDTDFRVPSSKLDRFAQLYTPKGTQADREAFLREGPKTKEIEPLGSTDLSDYDESATHFSGGGGLASTAHDYLRFCQMLLNGGHLDGVRILSRKTVELMTSDHLDGIAGYSSPGSTFGLGFSVVTDPAKTGSLDSVGTYAWGGAAGTRFWIDPKEELIGIFMVQILPHRTRMGEEFRLLTYQAIDD